MLTTGRKPTLHFAARQGLSEAVSAADVVYRSRRTRPDGASVVQLHRLEEGVGIRLPKQADFLLQPRRVAYAMAPTGGRDDVEINFFGVALPLWLEMRSVSVFHASCVALGGRAMGLLADCGGGKTTLALELMERGFSLLSDDQLAVKVEGSRAMALSAVPEIRLWPEQAKRYFGSEWAEGRYRRVSNSGPKLRVPLGERVESFASSQRELVSLVLVERSATTKRVAIEELSAREALPYLLRFSALPLLCEAVGLGAERLDRLAGIAANLAVRRLRCPEGLEHLPGTVAALREELSRS